MTEQERARAFYVGWIERNKLRQWPPFFVNGLIEYAAAERQPLVERIAELEERNEGLQKECLSRLETLNRQENLKQSAEREVTRLRGALESIASVDMPATLVRGKARAALEMPSRDEIYVLLDAGITAIGGIADVSEEPTTQEEIAMLQEWRTKAITYLRKRGTPEPRWYLEEPETPKEG